jgi:hypothetical protein
MDPFLGWLESSTLSVWTRESTSILAFPGILSAHAVGMALAAGVNAAIALHLLGVGPGIPTREMRRFVGVLWIGFWMNAASGVLLLIAYPTKALTNPVFFIKLSLIAVAMGIFAVINRRLFRNPLPADDWTAGTGRVLAVASLVSWAGAITAGRLLAYTYRRLRVDF